MTIKSQIIKYLEEHPDYQWGGTIAREVGSLLKKKESNVERRCRELENAEIIEANYAKVDGEGNSSVRYRIKPKIIYQPKWELKQESLKL